MKKLLNLIVSFSIVLILSSCFDIDGPDVNDKIKDPEIVNLQILTVNDLHGYIEDSSNTSFSKTSAFIKNEVDNFNTNTLVVGVGDMFQGTAISNINRGKVVVDSMNEAGFHTTVIGNHEFDWGIEEIARFNDGNIENGEANFSFLACNIMDKRTNELLDFTNPYEIYEFNGLRVGIVGAIGDVYNSISASRVRDYEFLDPVLNVKTYTKKLRTEENVDIVILAIHYGSTINYEFTSLEGDYKIDAILNAHTHYKELETNPIIQLQAGGNGQLVGEINMSYDIVNNEMISSDAKLHEVKGMTKRDLVVDEIINSEKDILAPILQEELTIFDSSFSKEQMAVYGSNVIVNAFDVDFAMVNSGMYRTTFYPNQTITYANMINMVPFDNEIKLVTLTGLQIRSLYASSRDLIEYPVQVGSNIYTASGELLENDKKYRVAAVDYVFDQSYYTFLSGDDIEHTSIFIRDILVMDLRLQTRWDIFKTAAIGKIEW